MKTYTVCHTDFGYITHSYVVANSLESANFEAKKRFINIRSVMKF